MVRKSQLILFFALLFVSNSAAIYVGTAPGVKDLGEIERGEQRQVKFYVVSNMESPFHVRPGFNRPQSTIYREEVHGRYDFVPQEASQEDISSWVSFPQKRFQVFPETQGLVSLEDGGVANVNGEVRFFLEVPQSAEPGYHAGAINLNPQVGSGGSGTGVSTMGVTQFVFVFRVPGSAERNIEILEVNGIRTGEQQARLDFLLKNQGTVTTRISRAETILFNDFGNTTGALTTGGMYLSPGQTKVISTYWSGDRVEGGEFRARGEMNYITGNAFIDESVQISDYIQIESSDDDGEGQGIPIWLVVIVLVLIGVLMYFFDIDPIWIVVAMFFFAISIFVLVTELPVYLIGILLLLTAFVVYRVM